MSEPRESDPVGTLAEQVADLVRKELARAREELRESAKSAGLGGSMIAAAVVAGLYGGAAVTAAAVLLLARRLPAWAAAAVVGLGVSAAVAALAGRGIGKVRAASALPGDALRETAETLDAARQQQNGHRP